MASPPEFSAYLVPLRTQNRGDQHLGEAAGFRASPWSGGFPLLPSRALSWSPSHHSLGTSSGSHRAPGTSIQWPPPTQCLAGPPAGISPFGGPATWGGHWIPNFHHGPVASPFLSSLLVPLPSQVGDRPGKSPGPANPQNNPVASPNPVCVWPPSIIQRPGASTLGKPLDYGEIQWLPPSPVFSWPPTGIQRQEGPAGGRPLDLEPSARWLPQMLNWESRGSHRAPNRLFHCRLLYVLLVCPVFSGIRESITMLLTQPQSLLSIL